MSSPEENKEKERERNKKYYDVNRKRILEYTRLYKINNPDKANLPYPKERGI